MEKYFGKYQSLHQIRPGIRTRFSSTGFQLHNHKRPAFILPMNKPDPEMAIICTKASDKSEPSNQVEIEGNELCISGKGNMTPELILDLRKQYMTHKLRKLMALEIVKNRVRGDLKRIVKQMNSQVQASSKEFIVLGGGTKSLNYFKAPTPGNNGGFTLEVDVRGYMPANISVDTSNNQMTIKAIKVNGLREKALSLLAPSTTALEKVKITPPINGFLLLKYPNES